MQSYYRQQSEKLVNIDNQKAILEVLHAQYGADKNIEATSHIIDDLDGDDFDYIELITAIEEKLSIKIDENIVGDVNTVQDLYDLVEKVNGNN